MPNTQDIYITGLRNAHAMENQALSILRPQVKRIEHYPEVAERIEQHIAETERQIDRLDQLLDRVDGDRSALKDTALSMAGSIAAIGHTMAPDEIIKNSFANFAFENYEIAAYKSLVALAEGSGEAEAVSLLQANLDEELAMAEWLDTQIQPLTLRYASLSSGGVDAKN